MKSIITVGLGFGDEGKGTVVDALVRQHKAKLVIRYNGGAQASHNVVTNDDRHHCFHQFGSGSLVPGCRTLLTRWMLVNPLVMMTEAVKLEHIGVPNALRQMFIDELALITTPYHRAMNRLREFARKDGRHGSCGMGIGETMADSIRRPHGAIRAGDLLSKTLLAEKLNRTRNEMVAQSKQLPLDAADYAHPLVERELDTFDVPLEEIVQRYMDFAGNAYILDKIQIANLLEETAVAVFEGAQGVLLDEAHGFHPYTTWSTTTSTNAHLFLQEFGHAKAATEIGIIRSYFTRHGPGPFPTFNSKLTEDILASGEHNGQNEWQQDFRCGWLDLALLDYALRINGPVDGLAVTNYDHLRFFHKWPVTVGYPDVDLEPHKELMDQEQRLTIPLMDEVKQDRMTVDAEEVLGLIASTMHTKIMMTSEGPRPRDKKFL
jgi:adenylosuccinate synthase